MPLLKDNERYTMRKRLIPVKFICTELNIRIKYIKQNWCTIRVLF